MYAAGGLTFVNSIIEGNFRSTNVPADISNTNAISRGFNIYGVSRAGVTNAANPGSDSVGVNSNLVALTNLAQTAYHAPLAISVAVGGGNNLVAPGTGGDSCDAIDQIGLARPNGICTRGAIQVAGAALQDEKEEGSQVRTTEETVDKGSLNIFMLFGLLLTIGALRSRR
jgi:hypothetical protein